MDINRSGSLGCDIYGSSLRALCSNTFAYSMNGALSGPIPALGDVPDPAVGAWIRLGGLQRCRYREAITSSDGKLANSSIDIRTSQGEENLLQGTKLQQ